MNNYSYIYNTVKELLAKNITIRVVKRSQPFDGKLPYITSMVDTDYMLSNGQTGNIGDAVALTVYAANDENFHLLTIEG